MSITKLDAVNVLLGKLGARPVNTLEAAHPHVPAALATLERLNKRVQAKKWWFNTEYPTLAPDAHSARIVLPGDALSVDAVSKYPRVAPRGRFLYNLTDSTLEFSEPIQVRVHRLIPFEELPHVAAEAVLAAAVFEWLLDMDGDGEKLRIASADRQEAATLLHAEHIRSSQRNLLLRPSVLRRMSTIIGDNPTLWSD